MPAANIEIADTIFQLLVVGLVRMVTYHARIVHMDITNREDSWNPRDSCHMISDLEFVSM